LIDNRGGAGGTVGASIASKAAPDGYTFFMGAAHHAIAPSIYPKLDYDLEKSFIPMMLVASPPQVIVINPKVPANDLKEFIQLLKKSPGKYNYGSAGNGSSHHLAGELFKMQTKTFITHIPYRGAGPALADLIAGQVDVMFDGLGSSSQHIKSGKIKALAVASENACQHSRMYQRQQRLVFQDMWLVLGMDYGLLKGLHKTSLIKCKQK
jgi:tripartite-type tricarboxylate transporter receptor subunit TctC